MTSAHMEILVEPFRENDPGPHVAAVVEALDGAGLGVDMGPFATTVTGELEALLAAIEPLYRAGFEAGATSIQLRLETS